jgi:hypothetical protein
LACGTACCPTARRSGRPQGAMGTRRARGCDDPACAGGRDGRCPSRTRQDFLPG